MPGKINPAVAEDELSLLVSDRAFLIDLRLPVA